jgi:hypothetical protein
VGGASVGGASSGQRGVEGRAEGTRGTDYRQLRSFPLEVGVIDAPAHLVAGKEHLRQAEGASGENSKSGPDLVISGVLDCRRTCLRCI